MSFLPDEAQGAVADEQPKMVGTFVVWKALRSVETPRRLLWTFPHRVTHRPGCPLR